MYKTANKGYRNSIAFDALTDDPTALNYLALAYTIAGYVTENGRYYPEISKTCRAFKLYETKERKTITVKTKGKPNLSKRINLKAINVFTGEEKEFFGIEAASKYTGVAKGTIAYYTCGKATPEAKTKEGWKFKKIKK